MLIGDCVECGWAITELKEERFEQTTEGIIQQKLHSFK